MSRAGRLLLAALWLGSWPAWSARIQVPDYQGWVSDYAGVLTPETESRLRDLLQELEEATGAEIAVLTVGTTGGEDIFDYAMAVAEAWKPGKKDQDNGVLLVAAIQDRKMYILVGYGLEGILPDGKVGAIEDQFIIPAFRRGDYSAGIMAGVSALARVIADDAGVKLRQDLSGFTPSAADNPPQAPGWVIALIVILFLLLILSAPFRFAGRRRGIYLGSGWGGGGFGGGGFGGFGGGGFGGGGAGRSW